MLWRLQCCLLIVCHVIAIDKEFKYSVLLDAGSTGTRVYIYKFLLDNPIESIVEIAHKRMNPGLSKFFGNLSGIFVQINSLMEFAKNVIPKAAWSESSISLKATAGLRSLPPDIQSWIISTAANALADGVFRFDHSQTRVISGQEEALYDWLAVTTALRKHVDGQVGYTAAADMGGSSKQFAFVIPVASNISGTSCTPDWSINLPGVSEAIYLYAKSLEKFGLIDAMDYVIFANLSSSTAHTTSQPSGDCLLAADQCSNGFLHPCLAVGVHPPGELHDHQHRQVMGSGDFDQCAALIRTYFQANAMSYIDPSCVQLHRPRAIVGLDNFPKVLEMLGLRDKAAVGVSPLDIALAGRAVCGQSWESLLSLFPGYPSYRAQRACFGAAYIHVLLTDLYGLQQHNHPEFSFSALETRNAYDISWTLGAAVHSSLGTNSIRRYSN